MYKDMLNHLGSCLVVSSANITHRDIFMCLYIRASEKLMLTEVKDCYIKYRVFYNFLADLTRSNQVFGQNFPVFIGGSITLQLNGT